jgi:hypothetical protein
MPHRSLEQWRPRLAHGGPEIPERREPLRPAALHLHPTGSTDLFGAYRDTLVAGIVAGDEILSLTYTPRDAGSSCAGITTTEQFNTATRVPGLVRMQTHPHLSFAPITSDHDDLYYVRPSVDTVADATVDHSFGMAQGELFVTAASLKFGGLEDIPNNWTTRDATGRQIGHNTHRIGTDVDFDGPADNQRVWNTMIQAGRHAGFEHCAVHGRNHVHC